MTIEEFLNGLTLAQLNYTYGEVLRRLREYEESDKVVLYVLSGLYCNEACYREDEWDKAKEHLVELIKDDSFESEAVGNPPRIKRIKVSELEVEEWMSINEENVYGK